MSSEKVNPNDISSVASHARAGDAQSLDSRVFSFEAVEGLNVEPGCFVTLQEPSGRVQIGQVLRVSSTGAGTLVWSGDLLGVVKNDGTLNNKMSHRFSHAMVAEAEAKTIDQIFDAAEATLHVGSLLTVEASRACLMPQKFNRHTFWCGQSGSGKTFALGVLLEQLLISTNLPMVVFDPNADFVRIRESHPLADGASIQGQALAEEDIRILRPSSPNGDGLYVRFTDLSMRAKAAVLRLDPLVDRDEYNELIHLELVRGSRSATEIVAALRERDEPAATALATRVENLRIVDWDVWAMQHQAVTEVLDGRPDATVLDLGGFAFPDESLVVAMAVLDDLWAKRERRNPILIVIDEAHNLCSPETVNPLHTAVRDRIIQIAAEGRKFGLWLLLSTQRPSRIHPSIISQCDNLALMKMSSVQDLAELGAIFGFVPPALLKSSPKFRQGEALFAGGFVPAPSLIRMGSRLTREGGSDVKVPLKQVHEATQNKGESSA